MLITIWFSARIVLNYSACIVTNLSIWRQPEALLIGFTENLRTARPAVLRLTGLWWGARRR